MGLILVCLHTKTASGRVITNDQGERLALQLGAKLITIDTSTLFEEEGLEIGEPISGDYLLQEILAAIHRIRLEQEQMRPMFRFFQSLRGVFGYSQQPEKTKDSQQQPQRHQQEQRNPKRSSMILSCGFDMSVGVCCNERNSNRETKSYL
jgi:hypothetical protein